MVGRRFFALENAQEMVKMVQAGVPLYRAYAAYAADSIAQKAKRRRRNAPHWTHRARSISAGLGEREARPAERCPRGSGAIPPNQPGCDGC